MPYIERRRRLWYAVMHVPPDVRGQFNKRKFRQSLKTENRSQAQRLAGPVVATWKEMVRKARGHDEIAIEAMIARDMLKKAETAGDREFIKDLIADQADDIWKQGADPYADNTEHEHSSTSREAHRFYDLATGALIEIEPLVEHWLSETETTERTKDMRRADLRLLTEHHKTAQDITRKVASDFLREVLNVGRTASTVNRKLTAYSRFWNWLIDRGHIPEETRNPWERQRLPTKAEVLERRAFTEKEALAYLEMVERSGNRFVDDLALVRLQVVTGMRADEVAHLKIEDVELDEQGIAWISIKRSKTKAGVRTVPVVAPSVVADLRRRCQAEPTDWVFAHLVPDRYGNRAQRVSRRLHAILDKINPDPTIVASHSWRHRARTLLERAGITPWVADWFIGHARPGVGLSTYSGGPSREQLLEAAQAIPLPTAPGQPPVEPPAR